MKRSDLKYALFPALILYDEIILHASTSGGYGVGSFFATLFFSFSFGCVLQLICSAFKGRGYRVATKCFMIVLAIFFLATYIIHLQFKIFYDINTMAFAAKDATTGFGGEILRLVTSAPGLAHVALYLAPVIAAFVYDHLQKKRGAKNAPSYDRVKRLAVLGACVVFFVAARLVVSAQPRLRAAYHENYSYAGAVRQFGLLTGARKDVWGIVTGQNQKAAFTVEDNTMPQIEPEPVEVAPVVEVKEPEEEEPEEIVYEDNALDIDFEALSQTGGALGAIDAYVASLTPSKKNAYTGLFQGKNLIFLSLESFSGFMISEELTPTLYRLQTKGVVFNDFYQPSSASTTGGEYELIKGLLPMAGAASMTTSAYFHNYMTLGSVLTRQGYFGQMYHNGDSYYYDRYITHNRLGYSEPYMAYGSGLQALVEMQWPRSDVDMINATVPLYIENEPFNIYYMTVSGHAPYSPANSYYAGNPYGTSANGTNYFAEKNLERVQDLPYRDLLKYYIACNLEVEDMAATLLEQLEDAGVLENTVIVMCADHFPYGINDGAGYKTYLEELYGFPIENDLDRDRNALIIWTPELEEMEPIVVDDPVSSIDILPTLLNLFGAEFDSRLFAGRDALSDAPALVFNISYDWKTSYGTYVAATGDFTPAKDVDVRKIPDNYIERISTIVNNKVEYCRSLTYNDYFYHVFGDELQVEQPPIVVPPMPKAEPAPEETPAEGEVPAEGEGAPEGETPAEGGQLPEGEAPAGEAQQP